MIEEQCDDDTDKNVALARKLLDERSRTNSSVLLPKGGIKLNRRPSSAEESARLQSYHNAQDTVISSWKVRKIANLGVAEWMPDLKVAKVVKQGKFMQTKSHIHKNGFFALYSEEALYLLDVGDIELTYQGTPLSMQDAYVLLLSSSNEGGDLCTIDDYLVFAHLSRMGYRVQRYIPEIPFQFDNKESSSSNTATKRAVSTKSGDVQLIENIAVKRLKLCHEEDSTQTTLKQELNSKNGDHEVACRLPDKLCRDWWTAVSTHDPVYSTADRLCISKLQPKISFPNMGEPERTKWLKEQNVLLLPPRTSSREYEILPIWQQRLRKDCTPSDSLSRSDHSHPKNIDYHAICRIAENWSHYKQLKLEALRKKEVERMRLFDLMQTGDVKPLMNPEKAYDTLSILRQLDIFKGSKEDLLASSQVEPSGYAIKFNVFQTDSTKPFRKTQPGKPYLRIVVSNPRLPVPTLYDQSLISKRSDGVPVKIAFVDGGKIAFFGFDRISIPTDVIMG